MRQDQIAPLMAYLPNGIGEIDSAALIAGKAKPRRETGSPRGIHRGWGMRELPASGLLKRASAR